MIATTRATATPTPTPTTPTPTPRAPVPAADQRPTSTTTVQASAFVEAHLAEAEALGSRLADLVDDPGAFVAALRDGFGSLADPVSRSGQGFIAPGLGPHLGVRQPLIQATRQALRRRLRGARSSSLLYGLDALLREPTAELRWFAIPLVGRILPDDAERGWQLLRRTARTASEWITVDTLAEAYGRGIILETYRWAELEQLVYSRSRWERRLVGSTVATIPFVDRTKGRTPDTADRGLALLAELIGDAEPDVQKALSWALRSLTVVDRGAVAVFCEDQAGIAATTNDGHRAWVIRDSLVKLDADLAARLRRDLDGVRRRSGSPPTSRAAATAADFGDLPDLDRSPNHR
jgi:3-methyladenine DNA glycosylase AlkD